MRAVFQLPNANPTTILPTTEPQTFRIPSVICFQVHAKPSSVIITFRTVDMEFIEINGQPPTLQETIFRLEETHHRLTITNNGTPITIPFEIHN